MAAIGEGQQPLQAHERRRTIHERHHGSTSHVGHSPQVVDDAAADLGRPALDELTGQRTHENARHPVLVMFGIDEVRLRPEEFVSARKPGRRETKLPFSCGLVNGQRQRQRRRLFRNFRGSHEERQEKAQRNHALLSFREYAGSPISALGSPLFASMYSGSSRPGVRGSRQLSMASPKGLPRLGYCVVGEGEARRGNQGPRTLLTMEGRPSLAGLPDRQLARHSMVTGTVGVPDTPSKMGVMVRSWATPPPI
jgi:hypothetical protein